MVQKFSQKKPLKRFVERRVSLKNNRSVCIHTRNARNKIGSSPGRRGGLLMAGCKKTDWHIRRRSDTLLIFYRTRPMSFLGALIIPSISPANTDKSVDCFYFSIWKNSFFPEKNVTNYLFS